MTEQVLDRMELERERGDYHQDETVRSGTWLNIVQIQIHSESEILPTIDFPMKCHALKAVEGALLLVDATQGVQAQTLTTLKWRGSRTYDYPRRH